MRRLVPLALMVSACAGQAESTVSRIPPPFPGSGASQTSSRPPPGTLWRDEVVRGVDAGLGEFLGKVEVEASLVDNRFEGFRIIALRPPEFWAGVDLLPGDIVTAVNGRSIERDTQAFEAFESLRTAPELHVALLRNGRKRELRYRIMDRSSPTRRQDYRGSGTNSTEAVTSKSKRTRPRSSP